MGGGSKTFKMKYRRILVLDTFHNILIYQYNISASLLAETSPRNF